MSANADSVGFKRAGNVHGWAYFEKLPVSGTNTYFLQKNWPMVLDRTQFLYIMSSWHYSNDAKDVGSLDRCGLPLNSG